MATFTFDSDTVLRGYSRQDFETASIRSAAPSYVSEAPSYHTTVSNSEPIPPYSPPSSSSANNHNTTSAASAVGGPTTTTNAAAAAGPGITSNNTTTPTTTSRTHSLPTLLPSNTAHLSTPGLPPIPPAPRRCGADVPSLGAFRIPSWSIVNTNPTYQRVATRRAQAAMSSGEGLLRTAARVLDRVNEEGSSGSGSGNSSGSSGSDTPRGGGGGGGEERVRPLEDPYLVGEEAAARARRERLARENGDAVLYREDRRWDFFLAQQRERDENERAWNKFRQGMSSNTSLSRGRLTRRFAYRR